MTNTTETKKTPVRASANTGRPNTRRPVNGGSNKPAGSKPPANSTPPKDTAPTKEMPTTASPEETTEILNATGPRLREMHADLLDDLSPINANNFDDALAAHKSLADAVKKRIDVPLDELIQYRVLLLALDIVDKRLDARIAALKEYVDQEVGGLRNDTARAFLQMEKRVGALPKSTWIVAIVVGLIAFTIATFIRAIDPSLPNPFFIGVATAALAFIIAVLIAGTSRHQKEQYDKHGTLADLGLENKTGKTKKLAAGSKAASPK